MCYLFYTNHVKNSSWSVKIVVGQKQNSQVEKSIYPAISHEKVSQSIHLETSNGAKNFGKYIRHYRTNVVYVSIITIIMLFKIVCITSVTRNAETHFNNSKKTFRGVSPCSTGPNPIKVRAPKILGFLIRKYFFVIIVI